MVNISLLVGISAVAFGVALIAYMLALRSRYHYTSALTCPKCGRPFEYKWVPGASFSALRLGRDRHLKCPLCSEWSTFNILDTRIEPPRKKAAPGPL